MTRTRYWWAEPFNAFGVSRAHFEALGVNLPKGFRHWDIADVDGFTVAHYAANYGKLPEDFDKFGMWGARADCGRTVRQAADDHARLRDGFGVRDWATVIDGSGLTLAHLAAELGLLPKDFDRWEIADKNDWCVARAALVYRSLPEGFDRWELADAEGWTVAHSAASMGRLPEGYDRWELADHKGQTVAHVAAYWGYLPDDFDLWELADEDGRTVRDEDDERKSKLKAYLEDDHDEY